MNVDGVTKSNPDLTWGWIWGSFFYRKTSIYVELWGLFILLSMFGEIVFKDLL